MGMIDTQISLSARVRMCAVGRSGHAWFKLLPTEHVTSQRNERSNARIVIDNKLKFTSRHASRTHSRAPGRGRLYIVTDSRIVPNDALLIKFDCRGYVGARAAEAHNMQPTPLRRLYQVRGG
jgi:hypothetical protein